MPASKGVIRRSLKDAIKRFETLEGLLLAGEIDDALLRDFRASLNRVRTTAWGVQQYVDQKQTGQDPGNILAVLAMARIRTAYDLCKTISSDLKRPDISIPAGTLVEFQGVVQKLNEDVNTAVKALG